jgi:hypothetical protein
MHVCLRLACTLSYTPHGGVLHYVNNKVCDVPIALSFTHSFRNALQGVVNGILVCTLYCRCGEV